MVQANRELNEQKLAKPEDLQKGIKASWNLPEALEKNAVMPYYYGVKGNAAGKFPLFLYLHGSGPKEQEWATGLILGNRFQDGPSLYFIHKFLTKATTIAGGKWLNSLLGRNLSDRHWSRIMLMLTRLYVFGII